MTALPDWCEPLLDASQMRAVDGWAIEERHVSSLELMERAGAGVAGEVERVAPDGQVAVVCGKGNNGGDGLVAARLLRERARPVAVVCACDPAELSGDARANLERLPGEAPQLLADAKAVISGARVIVDALLGTGFQDEPHGEVAQAVQALNVAPARVVSVDVPSGVDASSGAIAGVAVRAHATVTFHRAKPGLWIAPGKGHAGEVVVLDIGIPRGAPEQATVGLIGAGVLERLPRRSASSTKFTSGHVVVVGGSRGLMGAPAMASLAAMRSGAGYVTACVPATQAPLIDAQLMEVMSRALPDRAGALTPEGIEETLAALERAGALALGPGLGRSEGAFELARGLAARADVATLIDADGLGAHAGRLHELSARRAPTVLTPHAGELGRLLQVDGEQVQRERLRHVRDAAARAQAVVVLKGDDTLVAGPDGRVAVSRGGAPALATAGTGDVLSGAIAALLAQGLDGFTAAAAGVYLHAWAAREATRRVGGADGVIAGDVIDALPAARGGRAS